MQKLDTKLMTSIFNKLNIKTDVRWNLSPNEIEEICIQEGSAKKTNLGAISVDTGSDKGNFCGFPQGRRLGLPSRRTKTGFRPTRWVF